MEIKIYLIIDIKRNFTNQQAEKQIKMLLSLAMQVGNYPYIEVFVHLTLIAVKCLHFSAIHSFNLNVYP